MNRTLNIISFLVFASALSVRAIDPVVPQIAADFSISTTTAALLAAAFAAYGLAQPVLGPMADAFGKARIMIACLLLLAVSSFLSAVVTDFWLLFVLRILAGAAATDVPVSHWLLALSLFGFLSLALAKRFVEVSALGARAESRVGGRGYIAGDAQVLGWLGVASGSLSVLVLALYITSRDVTALYSHPAVLWFACPLMLYWISRVWLLAHRGDLHEDPLVFALRDPPSYLVAAATALVMFAAS